MPASAVLLFDTAAPVVGLEAPTRVGSEVRVPFITDEPAIVTVEAAFGAESDNFGVDSFGVWFEEQGDDELLGIDQVGPWIDPPKIDPSTGTDELGLWIDYDANTVVDGFGVMPNGIWIDDQVVDANSFGVDSTGPWLDDELAPTQLVDYTGTDPSGLWIEDDISNSVEVVGNEIVIGSVPLSLYGITLYITAVDNVGNSITITRVVPLVREDYELPLTLTIESDVRTLTVDPASRLLQVESATKTLLVESLPRFVVIEPTSVRTLEVQETDARFLAVSETPYRALFVEETPYRILEIEAK